MKIKLKEVKEYILAEIIYHQLEDCYENLINHKKTFVNAHCLTNYENKKSFVKRTTLDNRGIQEFKKYIKNKKLKDLVSENRTLREIRDYTDAPQEELKNQITWINDEIYTLRSNIKTFIFEEI